jgi:hypothetical protein
MNKYMCVRFRFVILLNWFLGISSVLKVQLIIGRFIHCHCSLDFPVVLSNQITIIIWSLRTHLNSRVPKIKKLRT